MDKRAICCDEAAKRYVFTEKSLGIPRGWCWKNCLADGDLYLVYCMFCGAKLGEQNGEAA